MNTVFQTRGREDSLNTLLKWKARTNGLVADLRAALDEKGLAMNAYVPSADESIRAKDIGYAALFGIPVFGYEITQKKEGLDQAKQLFGLQAKEPVAHLDLATATWQLTMYDQARREECLHAMHSALSDYGVNIQLR